MVARRHIRPPVTIGAVMEKEPKIKEFSGTPEENFRHWFDNFISITNSTRLTEERKIALLKRSLTGLARDTFEALEAVYELNLTFIKQELDAVFCADDEPEDWIIKLNDLKYQNNENIVLFAAKIKNAVT
jgi:hypothetical protein